VTHIVALSGGKDSTAMALRLAEVEPKDYVYVCTPTGDELPEMLAHWERLEMLLHSSILRVRPPADFKGLCRRMNALPGFRMRFCTRYLKIIPYQAWLMDQLPAVSYVGLRADEEGRAGIEWDSELMLSTRYPLREWGWDLSEVQNYLHSRGVEIPPRTDCARCFYQTLYEWYSLWNTHPEIYADAEAQEVEYGHTFRSPQRDTWPTSLCDLREKFELGRVPQCRTRGEGCRVCSL
jgi:3'-phosphoadenosine 5'-phosphosulfate sulfotransferase (PAPS reductase)/FAD synthetase